MLHRVIERRASFLLDQCKQRFVEGDNAGARVRKQDFQGTGEFIPGLSHVGGVLDGKKINPSQSK
jgi:hypothetical protein